MKLFHWNATKSNACYGRGDIIVMAPDLETAKTLAREHMKSLNSAGDQFIQGMKEDAEQPDASPFEKQPWLDWCATLEADLAAEPLIHEQPAVIQIRGSE